MKELLLQTAVSHEQKKCAYRRDCFFSRVEVNIFLGVYENIFAVYALETASLDDDPEQGTGNAQADLRAARKDQWRKNQ